MFSLRSFITGSAAVLRRISSKARLVHVEAGKCSVNNVDLFYERVGDSSDVLLCLPGALGTTRSDFGPQLDQLKDKFTVVSYDPRGYGKSIPPKRDFPLDFYYRDVEDVVGLMKKLGFEKYSVLGWSDGGIAGMILTGKYPQLVERLVLWGANASVTDDDVKLYEAVRDTSKWHPKMLQPLKDLYGDSLQELFDGWCDCILAIKKANDGNLCQEFVPKISCPTLIIHGDKDPLVPFFHADYLHKNIKDSVLIRMPEGRHNLHLRYADEFNKYVVDFCKKQH